MAHFIIKVNHPLQPFPLNGLTEGRIDVVARCVSAALWLDHDLRRDVTVTFCFNNGFALSFNGLVKRMNPDERCIAGFIKGVLEGNHYPGIVKEEKTFEQAAAEHKGAYYLDIHGEPLRKAKVEKDAVFILGDNIGLGPLPAGAKTLSLGPKSYLSSHCIVLINNELDLR